MSFSVEFLIAVPFEDTSSLDGMLHTCSNYFFNRQISIASNKEWDKNAYTRTEMRKKHRETEREKKKILKKNSMDCDKSFRMAAKRNGQIASTALVTTLHRENGEKKTIE